MFQSAHDAQEPSLELLAQLRMEFLFPEDGGPLPKQGGDPLSQRKAASSVPYLRAARKNRKIVQARAGEQAWSRAVYMGQQAPPPPPAPGP